MNRRNFLLKAGVTMSSAAVAPSFITSLTDTTPPSVGSRSLDTWVKVRNEFLLDHDNIQMAQMLLASHPTRVREAIAMHRTAFDENPAMHWEEGWVKYQQAVIDAAVKYMGAEPGEVGLTDSTTQGMSLLLNGFKLKRGDEVLATTHDHYITDMSIKYACKKRGATYRRFDEYADPAKITVDEVVTNVRNAVRSKTRLLVVTWVHSCTGVKLPIQAIANEVAAINEKRSHANRLYFCVDGVHGFGNQPEAAADLGCDYFAAGTHKWIFGPRGTGVVYARKSAWDMVEPTIPPFRMNPFLEWLEEPTTEESTFGDLFTPGGFHAFEHRWSLNEAFEFQMEIGREEVHARTTELNTRLKSGLTSMPNVKLHTPLDPKLSAGINCFEIGNRPPEELVKDFHHHGIIASSSPYQTSYARLTPCIINTEDEVDQCIEVVRELSA